MQLTAILTVHTTAIMEAVERLNHDYDLSLSLNLYYPQQIDEGNYSLERLRSDIETADAVLLDIRGQGKAAEIAYSTLLGTQNPVINFMGPFGKLAEVTRLGAFTGPEFAKQMAKMSAGQKPFDELSDQERLDFREKVRKAQAFVEEMGRKTGNPALKDAGAYMRISRYYSHGGKENYYNLFLLLARNYLGRADLPEPAEPLEFPPSGFFHPDFGYLESKAAYQEKAGWLEGVPALGFLFYGGMHLDQNIPTLRAMMREFSGWNFLPVYSDGMHNLPAIREHFFDGDRPAVDAVVNLMWFRLNGGPMGGNPSATLESLRVLDVPVFAPACMFSQDIEKWEQDPQGLSLVMAIMAVIWPELDGCIEPIPCCGTRVIKVGESEVREVAVIDDRISRICQRIQKWIALKKKPNSKKRVAFIIYDYPPGEGNIGGASYLDVFQSVTRMLSTFKEEGYVLELPEKKLHEVFEERALVNSGKWFSPGKTAQNSFSLAGTHYLDYLRSLPDTVQEDMKDTWGSAPGDVMVHSGSFMLPALELGNVLVGLQPSRPPLGSEDLASASHDKTTPPHHQYLAYYHWLEHIWGADAVIHIGTHGLAEFTKGKEVGLCRNCFPDILIGNIPHLYLYHVLNTSESTIAKRRLYGTLVSYNSPPYTTSGLYEQYLELEDMIDEYDEAVRNGQDLRASRVEEKIHALAGELHMGGTTIPALHVELYEMKRRIIPRGLHVIGETYGEEAKVRFMQFILRYDRAGQKALPRILAESVGIPYDEAIRDPTLHMASLEWLESTSARVIDSLISDSLDAAVREAGVNGSYKGDLERTLIFGLSLAEKYADNHLEIGNLLHGLETGFIEPRLGGDVVRTPEVLPTGTNMNQFDPTRVPTSTASERGAEIAENTLRAALDTGGAYPESVGIVLWGFETTKTGGESIGQILSYLGVRVMRKAGTWYPELEVIPIAELGRPRVDCLLTICGFFRDMFPNLVQLLNQAFSIVSELDEPPEMNFVRKHSLENLKKLAAEPEGKLDIEEAKKIAYGRIYGPRAGEYGTRMLGLLEDSIWKDERDLAEIYIDSMDYLYADNIHARKTDSLYRQNLSHVQVVSQVRDSHDFEILDLDHYFEFFGGLSKAVEVVAGNRPALFISDTTNEVIRTEDIQETINRGVRTRLLNPRWIDGMLAHEFHGAQVIEERVYNTLGLAATTNAVENWVWSSIAGRFIFDEEMRKRLQENNKFATAGIIERLMEANQRGYWEATDEEIEHLREAYRELEGAIEETL